jgi:DNA polymerase-3 subunit beta
VLLHADLTKDTLKITTSHDDFTIKWISASEYVAVPSVQSDSSVSLQTKAFSYGISKVEYAVTEKNFSPVLTWVYIRTKDTDEGKKLVFVGTDSFRLGEYSIDFAWSWHDFSLIIPKVHINDIKRVADYSLSKEGDTMTLQYSDNMVLVSFQAGDISLHCTALLIQWTFPDYENENIMPTSFNSKVRIESSVLDKAIKKIWILTRDINNFINVQLQNDTISISSGDTDMWKWATQLSCLVEGELASFGMNGKYISDFLRSVQWDEVVLHVVDNQKPVIFKDMDDEQFTYIVRPLIK